MKSITFLLGVILTVGVAFADISPSPTVFADDCQISVEHLDIAPVAIVAFDFQDTEVFSFSFDQSKSPNGGSQIAKVSKDYTGLEQLTIDDVGKFSHSTPLKPSDPYSVLQSHQVSWRYLSKYSPEPGSNHAIAYLLNDSIYKPPLVNSPSTGKIS